MQRESYHDYMSRRLRNVNQNAHYWENKSNKVSLNSVEQDLYQRVEELERKVALLGGDSKQLELKI